MSDCIARSAPKCLRRFIGRSLTPANRPAVSIAELATLSPTPPASKARYATDQAAACREALRHGLAAEDALPEGFADAYRWFIEDGAEQFA